jgi:hypothetical protein
MSNLLVLKSKQFVTKLEECCHVQFANASCSHSISDDITINCHLHHPLTSCSFGLSATSQQ